MSIRTQITGSLDPSTVLFEPELDEARQLGASTPDVSGEGTARCASPLESPSQSVSERLPCVRWPFDVDTDVTVYCFDAARLGSNDYDLVSSHDFMRSISFGWGTYRGSGSVSTLQRALDHAHSTPTKDQFNVELHDRCGRLVRLQIGMAFGRFEVRPPCALLRAVFGGREASFAVLESELPFG